MQQSSRLANRLTRHLAVIAPAAVLLATIALFDPGTQLERHLNTAAIAETAVLADLAPPPAAPARALAAIPVEENSEAFWLTRAPEPESLARVAWTAPVAPGDRIVVNFGAWRRAMLDVVTVEDADSQATHIDTGATGEPRFVLSCRKVAEPRAPLVRLTVDADGRGITAVGTGDRSL